MSIFKYTLAILVLVVSNLLFLVGAAEDEAAISKEKILANSDVQGALAVIDAWIEGVSIYEKIPGLSVGIIYDQDLIWSNGYGFSNVASQLPANADTLYSVCSISKVFTAIGLMQLRDKEQLRLTDPVADHLSWFNITQSHEPSGPITIEGILTHSAGLPRESDFQYWLGSDFDFPTREQMIDRIQSQQTLYPAQTYFQYSNLGFSLVGEIIQASSGQDYAAYMQEHVLAPLGLKDTRPFYPLELRGGQLALGYSGIGRDGGRELVAPFFTRGITPAAGYTSSVNDLAKFISWQFRLLRYGGNEVLDAVTLREMQRVQWVEPDWQTTWGLGFRVYREGNKTFVGHIGSCPGYQTAFSVDPEQKLGVVVLTNAGDGQPQRLAINIHRVLGPELAKVSGQRDEEVPDYSMYEGNFLTQPWGGELAVRQWGDQLVSIALPALNLDGAMTKLKHVSEHTFVTLADDGGERIPWTFELGDNGTVERILYNSNYRERIE